MSEEKKNAAGADEKVSSAGKADEHTEEKPDTAKAGTEKTAEKSDDDAKSVKLSRSEKKALEKKEQELADMKDRYLRTMAEYENFRKRTEREKADLYSFAVKDTMTRMLPVMDTIERGIEAIPEDQKDDPFAEGMRKIAQQFENALDEIGVKAMKTEGEPFDPKLHKAVMHVDDPKLGKNVVAKELMKGYTYKETVIRHAMVSVAN